MNLIGLFTFSFLSLGVPETEFGKVFKALDQKQIFIQKSFTGAAGVQVGFTRFGSEAGRFGSIVVSPGRTESSLKYLEFAIDLGEVGFSPIYVIDHRGQGFSGRELSDRQKGYVKAFDDYVLDFTQFMDLVLSDPRVDQQRLFFVSHSMGGPIGLRYAFSHPKVFRKLALFSPMLKLPFESQVLAGVNTLCLNQSRCESYVPFGGPFVIEKSQFDRNDVTQSKVRFDWKNHLWLRFPEIQLGAPTNHWVRAAVHFNQKIRKLEKLKEFATPVQIFVAEKDRIVENKGSVEVCKNLKLCQLNIVKQSKHEILMESDSIRTPTLQSLKEYLYEVRSDD